MSALVGQDVKIPSRQLVPLSGLGTSILWPPCKIIGWAETRHKAFGYALEVLRAFFPVCVALKLVFITAGIQDKVPSK